VGIARKWVFPIVWIVIVAAAAAALIKLAFVPDIGAAAGVDQPTGEIVEPQVAVTTGSILNDVTVQGTVSADAAVPILATLAGEVREVYAAQGQWVEAGTPVVELRAQVMNPDGTSYQDWTTVVSPIAGTLTTFPVLVGQTFTVGDDVGRVSPPSFNVSGTLAPEQQYRLLTQPTEATVTITGGPAPFTCTGLQIIAAPPSSDGTPGTGGPTVRCTVPGDVRVFSGLGAQMVVAGGIAENVLVVPMTAVEGSAETGNVYFVLPDGSTELRPVVLGLNDGVKVEVKEGLADGDLILQFVPGAPAAPGDGGGFFGPVPVDPGTGEPLK
jgi:macrolide-specific efflux system membrane fusion protein